jgi:hypothetical protein
VVVGFAAGAHAASEQPATVARANQRISILEGIPGSPESRVVETKTLCRATEGESWIGLGDPHLLYARSVEKATQAGDLARGRRQKAGGRRQGTLLSA